MDQPGTEIRGARKASPRHHDPRVGNASEALAHPEFTFDAGNNTPVEHHNPNELFTTTCVWNGGELTVYEPSQFVAGMKHGLASELAINPAQVRVLSPFAGGAFGSKGSLTAPHGACCDGGAAAQSAGEACYNARSRVRRRPEARHHGGRRRNLSAQPREDGRRPRRETQCPLARSLGNDVAHG